MSAAENLPPQPGLRQILRESTTAQHDRLDQIVTSLDFSRTGDYRRFLGFQLAARRPVEEWLAAQSVPFALPPAQSELIAADLDDLGKAPPLAAVRFAPPEGADPIGACWALAGSSLGNRAMHRALLRAASEATPPARFLGDAAMPAYWQSLKPLLETRVAKEEAARAVACATAVFATFLAAVEDCLGAATAP